MTLSGGPHRCGISWVLLFTCGFVTALVAGHSAHAQTFTILYSFLGSPDGGGPNGVIRGANGTLYGTTYSDGASYNGTAFKLTPNGKETVLYSFLGVYGSNPSSVLTQDKKGNFYGGTDFGGAYGYGTIFKLDKKGNETVLHSFTGLSSPSGMILDAKGNLYGTTPYGGIGQYGTVFKLDKAGRETVLYSFTEGADGGAPYSGVIRDKAGNLYGTTSDGGDLTCGLDKGCGTVFKLDSAGKETVLYSFAGGTDGAEPSAGLIRDTAGNFYGTTDQGGDLSCGRGSGCGTVFRLDTTGRETVLYSFTGTGGDGTSPYAGVVRDPRGNLYGTTFGGGDFNCIMGQGQGCGIVFMLDTTGKETILHTFGGNPDGTSPTGLIRDATGDLYGTAFDGGSSSCRGGSHSRCGTVFKLTP